MAFFRPDGSTLEKLIALKAACKPVTAIEATASGNPAVFDARLVRPLIGCTCSFAAVQAGSGAPSPLDNVRPITGLDGLIVYHSGDDTSVADAYPVTWQTEAGTVYGGTLDLVSGTLSVKKICYTFNGQENFKIYDSGKSSQRYSVVLSTLSTLLSGANTSTSVCSHFVLTTDMNFGFGGARFISGYLQPFDPNGERWTDESGFTAWLAEQYANGTPVQLMMPITAQTYTLTPQRVTALFGTNKIWNSAGGTTSVTYLTKTSN